MYNDRNKEHVIASTTLHQSSPEDKKMVKKSGAQNLAPMGFYLTTICVLLNGSMKKSLSKMQSLDACFFVRLCFFKNVK
jgi:hypothetical protein